MTTQPPTERRVIPLIQTKSKRVSQHRLIAVKPTQRAHMSVGTDTTQELQLEDDNGMLKYLYHESDNQLKGPSSATKGGEGDNFQTLNNFMRHGFQVDVKVTRSPRPEEPAEVGDRIK